MKNLYAALVFILALLPMPLLSQNSGQSYPPEGFTYLHDYVPEAALEVRYYGRRNFVGRPIPGYEKPVILMSIPAAEALRKVQNDLKKEGLRLKVFDAYRPQRAVNHFMEWARNTQDTLMKSEFYPDVAKQDLFELGYIARKSGHTRGSTVDLTLEEIATGKELDMGSPYDFFGEISHHGSPQITAGQEANRNLLRKLMLRHGFQPLPSEWWHYTLKDEPFPDTYFDFPVR